MATGRQPRFFLERHPPARQAVVEVPAGLSWLAERPGELPRLRPCASPEQVPEARLAVETLDRRPGLLLRCPPEARVRLNGSPAPRLVWLRVKDVLELPSGGVLHLTEYLRPRLGPPPAELVGRPCPVCRVPVAPDRRVYVCSRCGTPIHAERGDGPEVLPCLYVGRTCLVCEEPWSDEEGYRYVPDGLEPEVRS